MVACIRWAKVQKLSFKYHADKPGAPNIKEAAKYMYRVTTLDVETSAPLLLKKLEVILIPKLSCLVFACWLDEVFKISYKDHALVMLWETLAARCPKI